MIPPRRPGTPDPPVAASGVIWSADLVVPVAAPPLQGGAIAVRDDRVVAVGPAAELRAANPDMGERAFGDAVIAPGFIDAHCHLEWSLTVPSATADFAAWMGAFLAMRHRMQAEDHSAAARLGALRRLAAGTTALADNGPTGAGVTALAERGMRGIVHLETFGDPAPGEASESAAARTAEAIAALGGDGIEVGLSPHAPYTVGPDLWAALIQRDELAGVSWSTHLAESPAELRWHHRGDGPLGEAYAPLGVVPARWGATSAGVIGALEHHGALRDGLIAAHCVRLEDGEAEVLAERSVVAVHCPSSNRRLLCGRMPLARLRGAGVTVALGTDSPASGGPFDLRVEARAAADLHAASGEAPDAEALVRMMTTGGASAIGRSGDLGALAPGYRADAVVLSRVPGLNAWQATIDERAEVRMTLIGGAPAWDRENPPADTGPIETSAQGIREGLC